MEYYASEEFVNNPVLEHEKMRLLERVDLSDIVMNEQDEYSETVSKILAEFAQNGGIYTREIFDIIATVRIPYGDPTKPNWRFLCIPEKSGPNWNKFIFISNHCSMDGTSASNLFRDICTQLNDLSMKEDKSNLVFDYALDCDSLKKLPSPIDERIEYRPPLSYFPQFLGSNFVRKHIGYHSNGPLVSRVDALDEGTACYTEFLNLTSQQMKEVKKKLKSKAPQCTMTPFLQACLLVSMYDSGKVFTGSMREWFFDVVIPMNTVQLLPDDGEVQSMYKYGSNIGGSRYNYLISSFNVGHEEEAFWNLVDYYRIVFESAREKNHYLYPLGALMMDAVCQKSNVDKLVVDDLIGKPREGAVFSNLGFISQEIDNKIYYMNDLVFSQTLGSLRHGFTLSSCTIEKAGMNIVACAALGTVENRSDWAEVCELFKKRILSI